MTNVIDSASGNKISTVTFTLQYQACNEKACQAPVKVNFSGKVAVAKP